MIPLRHFALVAAAFAWLAIASQVSAAERVSFDLDIQPILTARGCNQGACHGKARGQNGFQLSLLGFDSDFDFAALTKNARGRRIFLAAPEQSLLLRKGAGLMPHGGGVRIEPNGPDYAAIRDWIAAGAPRRIEGEPALERVEVTPTSMKLAPKEARPLQVVAYYSDGSKREVTARSSYQSNEAGIVGVDKSGAIKAGPLPGEAAVMVRYMSQIAICHVAIPLAGEVPAELYAKLPRHNFLDEQVYPKWQSLGITPSATCTDSQFLRRAHLDIIGRLPTPAEARAFLADTSATKRAALVDSLLARPEYADHWATKWADLLRPNPYRVGVKAVLNYDQWIRDAFRKNKPYDQFVRELVAAQGSTWRNGAATLYRDRREPDEIAPMISQLFLGVRLECAKCHHHPFEKWGQDDFYSFAAFFARIGHKGTGLSPPISGGEEIIHTAAKGEVRHPLTEQALPPRALFGSLDDSDPSADPRERLADWITSDKNPYFAQVIANRVWGEMMGRGIVDPVDDLRATNPPSNGPLLEALAAKFRADRYDLKKLIRWIATSHTYELSSIPSDRNAGDNRNFSRHYRTKPRGEVLLDAIGDVTGMPDSFNGTPPGSRANQVWTTRVESVFLDTFSRPNENQDPPCERTIDVTMTQTLHLMNSPRLHDKVTAEAGRAARLAASDATPDAIIDELYLRAYSRFPNEAERQFARQLFAEKETTRRKATEDLLWALINTPEFLLED